MASEEELRFWVSEYVAYNSDTRRSHDGRFYQVTRNTLLYKNVRTHLERVVQNTRKVDARHFVYEIARNSCNLLKYYHAHCSDRDQQVRHCHHDQVLEQLVNKVYLLSSVITQDGLASIIAEGKQVLYVDQDPCSPYAKFRQTDARRQEFVASLKGFVTEGDGLYVLWCFMWDLMCFDLTVGFLYQYRLQDVMMQSLCDIKGNILIQKIIDGIKLKMFAETVWFPNASWKRELGDQGASDLGERKRVDQGASDLGFLGEPLSQDFEYPSGASDLGFLVPEAEGFTPVDLQGLLEDWQRMQERAWSESRESYPLHDLDMDLGPDFD